MRRVTTTGTEGTGPRTRSRYGERSARRPRVHLAAHAADHVIVEVLPALEGAQPVTAFIVFWNIFVLATAADPWDVEEARVLAEHREYLIAQAQQGMAMPTLYVAGCDGDHDGASWSGPTRFSWDDAAADIAAHKS